MNGYLKHFGLKEDPFSTTPDPRFAHSTREHKLALAKVAYYTEERRGIFLLMGEVGTGKTTISKMALNNWRERPDEILAAYCQPALKIDPPSASNFDPPLKVIGAPCFWS
jgi:type II secretory pathway predicted ATPase ExeA